MLNRREFLVRTGGGCGMLALSALLQSEGFGEIADRPRVKSVIWLFMNGGPSSIDLFDPKPLLTRMDGQKFPGEIKTLFPYPGPIMASPFEFKQHGACGAPVSNVFPHLAQHVDDMTFLKACVTTERNHVPACYVANTGNRQVGSPHLASWVNYGLGSERKDLPDFIVMYDRRASPEGGANLWSSGYLPGQYQGVAMQPTDSPILYVNRPPGLSASTQIAQLDLLQWLNRRHVATRHSTADLDARIKSFETAFKMQSSMPKLSDLSRETVATTNLYGLNDPKCKPFGTQCLLARRMVEKGVRFVQLYHGGYDANWDQHGGLASGHKRNCYETDQPIAGLLADLKQRGLFDSTLVIWGGEFGRGPTAQDNDGRDHNPYGFTMWMAGGGLKRGTTHGQTDEFGYLPVENATSIRDVHATILHLVGLDDATLTYRYGGREQTPTGGLGRVITEIVA
jgi:hypothetical protein